MGRRSNRLNQITNKVYFSNFAMRLLLCGALILGFLAYVSDPLIDILHEHTTTIKIIEGTKKFAEEIAVAFIVAALLISTTERRSKDELNELFTSNLEEIKGTIIGGLRDIGKTVEISGIPSHLNSNVADDLIVATGEAIYKRYVNGIKAVRSGFAIHDVDWTMDSNEIFYRLFLDRNIKNQEIRITHTTDVMIWADDYAPDATLRLQRQLIREHGFKITRIFVGAEPTPLQHNSKYLRAMEKMKFHGVDTGYMYHKNPSNVTDMTWLPGLRLVMIWRPQISGKVALIEFTSDIFLKDDLQRDWDFAAERKEYSESEIVPRDVA